MVREGAILFSPYMGKLTSCRIAPGGSSARNRQGISTTQGLRPLLEHSGQKQEAIQPAPAPATLTLKVVKQVGAGHLLYGGRKDRWAESDQLDMGTWRDNLNRRLHEEAEYDNSERFNRNKSDTGKSI